MINELTKFPHLDNFNIQNVISSRRILITLNLRLITLFFILISQASIADQLSEHLPERGDLANTPNNGNYSKSNLSANATLNVKKQAFTEGSEFTIIENAVLDSTATQFVKQLTSLIQPKPIKSATSEAPDSLIERTKLRLPIHQLPTHKYRFTGYSDHKILTDLQLPLAIFNSQKNVLVPVIAQQWRWINHRLLIALNPMAQWSNGRDLVAMDLVTAFIKTKRQSHINGLQDNYPIDKIEIYNDKILSINFKTQIKITDKFKNKVLSIRPAAHYFYSNLSHIKNSKKYNQMAEPTTGPYDFNRSLFNQSNLTLTLTLKKSWWGRNLKLFKQRFTIQKVQYVEIESSPLQEFMATKLDMLPLLTSANNINMVDLFEQSNIEARIYTSDCNIASYRMKIVSPMIDKSNAGLGVATKHQKQQALTANQEMVVPLYYSDRVLLPAIQQFISSYQPKIASKKITPQKISSIQLTKLLSNQQYQLLAFSEPTETPITLEQGSYQTMFTQTYPSPSWLSWSWVELPYSLEPARHNIIHNLAQMNLNNMSMDPIDPIKGGYLRLNAKKKAQTISKMRHHQYKRASTEYKTINKNQRKESALWDC